MQPEVSVIIAAYNTEAYIAKAIESALEQTLENIEVIVVDDGSSDATVKVAKSIVDARLKILVNEKNMGSPASGNRAIQAAQGKWIAVLDSDDWYDPDRLRRLVQIADEKCADVIIDDLYLIRDGEDTPWSTLIGESGKAIDTIRKIDPVFFVKTDVYGKRRCLRLGLSKPLFSRAFLLQHGIQYDETLKGVAHDFWIDMECLVHGANFILVPDAYYFYRARPGSLVTGDKLDWLNIYCRATQDFLQKGVVSQHSELAKAFAERLAVFKRWRAYYRVVQPLKQGKVSNALVEMIKNPYFFVCLLMQFPSILERRFQYYFLGNQSAYEMLPRTKKLGT